MAFHIKRWFSQSIEGSRLFSYYWNSLVYISSVLITSLPRYFSRSPSQSSFPWMSLGWQFPMLYFQFENCWNRQLLFTTKSTVSIRCGKSKQLCNISVHSSGPKGEFLGGINYQRSPEEFLWCSEARAGGQEGDLGDGFHWL